MSKPLGKTPWFLVSYYLHPFSLSPQLHLFASSAFKKSVCNGSWGQYSCLMSLRLRVLVRRKGVTPAGPASIRHWRDPNLVGTLLKQFRRNVSCVALHAWGNVLHLLWGKPLSEAVPHCLTCSEPFSRVCITPCQQTPQQHRQAGGLHRSQALPHHPPHAHHPRWHPAAPHLQAPSQHMQQGSPIEGEDQGGPQPGTLQCKNHALPGRGTFSSPLPPSANHQGAFVLPGGVQLRGARLPRRIPLRYQPQRALVLPCTGARPSTVTH